MDNSQKSFWDGVFAEIAFVLSSPHNDLRLVIFHNPGEHGLRERVLGFVDYLSNMPDLTVLRPTDGIYIAEHLEDLKLGNEIYHLNPQYERAVRYRVVKPFVRYRNNVSIPLELALFMVVDGFTSLIRRQKSLSVIGAYEKLESRQFDPPQKYFGRVYRVDITATETFRESLKSSSIPKKFF